MHRLRNARLFPAIVLVAASLVFVASATETPAQKPSAGLNVTDVFFEDYSGAPTARWQMKPGEEVSLNFRIQDFGRLEAKTSEGLREDRVSLRYQIELRDPQGATVEPAKSGEIVTGLSAQDADWRPKIHWSATVPSAAPGGDYTVHIQVNDLVAKHQTEKIVSFRVLGQSALAADTLQISQVEFAASEQGPWNPERYFSPAETIWVRYQVSGYRVSPEKQVWVEQDWTVLDSDDKVVITQPNATAENERSFYPPKFIATSFMLNLKGPKPGKYTLRIAVRDRVGDQSISTDSNFFIRP